MCRLFILCLLIALSYSSQAFRSREKDFVKPAELIIDANFYQRKLTQAEIKTILDQFDTYDYIRTREQRENLVRYLVSESKRLNDHYGIARSKNILGVLLRDRAEYAKAIELHESALKHSGKDTVLNIFSLNNLGVVYRRLDQPRVALDYHMKALKLAEQFRGDPLVAQQSTSVALNSIGNINLVLNQPEKALEVFNQTLLIEEQLNNRLGMAINYQNIGYAYEAMGHPDVALTYYKKSLQQNEMINSDMGQSICYNSIGEILLKQEKPMEALRSFKMAMVFAERNNDEYYISQTHANIAKTYLMINSLERALPELLEYQTKAKKIGSALLIQDSYKLFSEYYEKKGDNALALLNFKTSVAFNDSIVNEKNLRYLNELQTLYESEKRDQQIEILTVENRIKTQQNYFYLFGVILLFMLGVLVYIAGKRRTDKQKTELESKLFRSLMNPHFIFNALGSIQSFLYKNEPEKAATYLGSFSKLTRSILKNSSKELITLQEEIDTLKYYVEIEQMRQRDCFDFQIVVDEAVETDFIYVLPTMLQPFVENAIHHGMRDKNCKNGLIKVEISQSKDYMHIVISDNGKGINETLKAKDLIDTHKSMGMNIFRERTKLFERKFKKSIKFDTIDLSDKDQNLTGTMVSIDFPIIDPDG
jgi:sensor histidine kinase YesM